MWFEEVHLNQREEHILRHHMAGVWAQRACRIRSAIMANSRLQANVRMGLSMLMLLLVMLVDWFLVQDICSSHDRPDCIHP